MSQDLKDINVKRESSASKRLLGRIDFTNNNDKKNRTIIIVAICILLSLLIGGLIYGFIISKKDTSYNQQLYELSDTTPPPADGGKQDEWASAQIDSLQKSNLSKSSNKDELAAYYNKLFTYYTMSNRTQEAKDLYVNEVKSRNIFLQVEILEWLLSTLSTDDVHLKKYIIDDLLSLLKQQLGEVEAVDKTEIEAKINYYEKAREVVK